MLPSYLPATVIFNVVVISTGTIFPYITRQHQCAWVCKFRLHEAIIQIGILYLQLVCHVSIHSSTLVISREHIVTHKCNCLFWTVIKQWRRSHGTPCTKLYIVVIPWKQCRMNANQSASPFATAYHLKAQLVREKTIGMHANESHSIMPATVFSNKVVISMGTIFPYITR